MTRVLKTAALTLAMGALAACSSSDGVQVIDAPSSGAYVKFFNFGINSPGANFFGNDKKLTAVSSTSCTPPTDTTCLTTGIETLTGTTYGNAANNGLYSVVPAGNYDLTARIATAANNGVTTSKVTTTLVDGTYYSVYQTGFYDATTKTAQAFMVTDPIPPTIDFTKATVRFVNASPNANPVILWAKNTVTGDSVAIGGAVAFQSAGAFVAIPGAAYDLTGRYVGSNTAVVTRAGVSLSNLRVSTITLRGDMTVSFTGTATNRPFLDNTLNR